MLPDTFIAKILSSVNKVLLSTKTTPRAASTPSICKPNFTIRQALLTKPSPHHKAAEQQSSGGGGSRDSDNSRVTSFSHLVNINQKPLQASSPKTHSPNYAVDGCVKLVVWCPYQSELRITGSMEQNIDFSLHKLQRTVGCTESSSIQPNTRHLITVPVS